MRRHGVVLARALGGVCLGGILLSMPAPAVAQTARQPEHRAWLEGGLGASSLDGPVTLVAAWYAYGHLAVGLRQTETSPGLMNNNRAGERSLLLGARASTGRLSLLAAAGVAHTSGRVSHGEQSGVTSPAPRQTVGSLHLEATIALTRVLGLGVAGFRVGGDPPTAYRGYALMIQVGKLR